MKTTTELRRSNEQYRKANPWIIQNLQNSQAMCGRFPTREAAVADAASYRGGVVSVNDASKVVYVSDMPLL